MHGSDTNRNKQGQNKCSALKSSGVITLQAIGALGRGATLTSGLTDDGGCCKTDFSLRSKYTDLIIDAKKNK